MKKILLTLCMITVTVLPLLAQQEFDTSVKKEAVSKLSMLTGKWNGSGWASSPDGSRNDFTQSEIVEKKLDGTAILVQGLGKRKGTEEVIHDALAVITYNEADSAYQFQSYMATGQSTLARGYFEGDKFIWGFEVPGGTVKYTIAISENKWNEIGEFSRDGLQWYQFFEMNLNKESEN